MTIQCEFHPEALLILPLLGFSMGECENPDCQAEHWMISAGWLMWSVDFIFDTGGAA